MKDGASEFDVVVVGGGPAGLAAVEAAAKAGATVALIEELDAIGGNAAISTGYLAFVDTEMQRRAGIRDSVDAFIADAERQVNLFNRNTGLIWDRELAELFAAESESTYDFLLQNGVRFDRIIRRPAQHSVDRMLAIADPLMLRSAYEPSLARPGVTAFFRSQVCALLASDGAVRGVTIRSAAKDANPAQEDIVARQGVVLACGGYQGNPEIRRRYQPNEMATSPPLGLLNCRGIGHVLGAAVGGDLINMSFIQPVIIVSSSLVEDAIAVNRAGRRFHDEAGPYPKRVQALKDQPEQTAYYVVDAVTARQKGFLLEQMPEPAIVGATLAELASRIGCDGGNLADSVAQWNAFLQTGESHDPAFGRVILPADRRGIVSGPFCAARMTIGTSFTWGGFTVTKAMQVVNSLGDPIRGLYAAGDTVGGLNVASSLGGLHICGALTLGRIAGAAGATGRTVAPHTPRLLDASISSAARIRMALFAER